MTKGINRHSGGVFSQSKFFEQELGFSGGVNAIPDYFLILLEVERHTAVSSHN